MDETIKHRIKQQYNRLSALLVFIANAFTLMYVGGMVYNDALWFGSVSGAFTIPISVNSRCSLMPQTSHSTQGWVMLLPSNRGPRLHLQIILCSNFGG